MSDTSEVPAPRALSPGDNPNKLAMRGRKKFRPRKSNTSSNVYNVVENIDPRPVPVKFQESVSFNDVRSVASEVVAEVQLRREFAWSYARHVQDCLDARWNLVSIRVNLPSVDHVGSFIAFYTLAAQAHQTLKLLNLDKNVSKLKALRMYDIQVPEFVQILSQSIGNYRTSEGIVKIRNLEYNATLWTYAACYHASRIANNPNLFPLTFPQNTFNVIWDLPSWQQDLIVSGTDIIQCTGDLIFPGAQPVNDVTVPFPLESRFIADYNTVVAAAPTVRIDPNALLLLQAKSQPNYAAMVASAAFGNLGFHDQTGRSIDDMIRYLDNFVPWYKRTYFGVIDKLFLQTTFAPSVNGTAAQFVRCSDDYQAHHEYKMTPQEVCTGFLLVPNHRDWYVSHYDVLSTRSRGDQFAEFANKFASDSDRVGKKT